MYQSKIKLQTEIGSLKEYGDKYKTGKAKKKIRSRIFDKNAKYVNVSCHNPTKSFAVVGEVEEKTAEEDDENDKITARPSAYAKGIMHKKSYQNCAMCRNVGKPLEIMSFWTYNISVAIFI